MMVATTAPWSNRFHPVMTVRKKYLLLSRVYITLTNLREWPIVPFPLSSNWNRPSSLGLILLNLNLEHFCPVLSNFVCIVCYCLERLHECRKWESAKQSTAQSQTLWIYWLDQFSLSLNSWNSQMRAILLLFSRGACSNHCLFHFLEKDKSQFHVSPTQRSLRWLTWVSIQSYHEILYL